MIVKLRSLSDILKCPHCNGPDLKHIKIYPESEFYRAKLLHDIPATDRKGFYAEDSIIEFCPIGIYVREGKYLCGWFKEKIQLVEGKDYKLI